MGDARTTAATDEREDAAPAVPDLSNVDVVFGNIKHLPPWDKIPDDFKRWSGNAYCDFVSEWFFSGRPADDLARIKERDGISRSKALTAIQAALRSFEPKHEHKIAGCGYLLSQWFELTPEGR